MQNNKEVVSVILTYKDKVLMHLRDNKKGIAFPNYWSLPSGRIQSGENPLDAAKREVEEETDYKLTSPSQFFPKHIFVNKPGVRITYFFIENYDQKQKINCNEGQKMEFKSVKEIEKLEKVVPGIFNIVREALDD